MSIESHLTAVQTALAAYSGTVYLVGVNVVAPALPYLLVEPAAADGDLDRPLDDLPVSLDVAFRLKGAATTPVGALRAVERAKALLAPSGSWAPLMVPGRSAHVRWLRHEADYLDPQATILETNSLTALSVDSYRLVSTPA